MRLAENIARAGCGQIEVEMVAGQSAVTSAWNCSPLKLLIPQPRSQSVWAYASSFGGGLVAGDQTRLDIRICSDARCFIGSQASTKIYRNPASRPCSHHTQATIESDALLVFAPDPVQAFAGSSYTQRQEFHLAENAGLVLLDWFTSGRAARGERWAFTRFASRNDVFVSGERVFVDSVLLDAESESLDSPHRTGRFNCFAMLLLIGEPVKLGAEKLLAEISARQVERRAPFICSASPIRDGVILRIASEDVESVGRELKQHLNFLTDVLGDNPWSRKW